MPPAGGPVSARNPTCGGRPKIRMPARDSRIPAAPNMPNSVDSGSSQFSVLAFISEGLGFLKRLPDPCGARMRFAEQLGENFRDLENGPVLLSGNVFAEFRERGRLQHALYSLRHIFETLQYDAYTLFLYPLRVVALLRQCPHIALNKDRKFAHHRRRQVGAQTHLFPQFQWVGIIRLIEIRPQDHSRRQKNVAIIMAHGTRLSGGFFRARDDVLLLDRLNPEARRKISQVGDNGDERPPGINLRPAFANLPVEMWNDGNKQVGGFFAPKLLEQVYQRPVKHSNGGLKNAKKLGAAQSPAVLQHGVVLLLDADPRQLAQDVQPVGKVLKLNKLDLPVALLLRNHRLKRDGCVAMPPSAIMEDNVNPFHRPDCGIGYGHPTRAHSMPCG